MNITDQETYEALNGITWRREQDAQERERRTVHLSDESISKLADAIAERLAPTQ